MIFTILTPANTARVNLCDTRADRAHSREVLTLADNATIANAILRYARERGCPLRLVGYVVAWPDGYVAPIDQSNRQEVRA